MYISGINRLLYYKFLNKRILLLGESHQLKRCEEEKNSILVSDYVISLIKRASKEQCVDVFIEGTYKELLKEGANSELFLLRSFLSRKDYENFRLHHVDPRNLQLGFNEGPQFGDLTAIIISFLLQKRQEGILFKSFISEKDIIKTIDYLVGVNRDRSQFKKIFEDYFQDGLMLDTRNIVEWEKEYFRIMEKQFRKLDKTIMTKPILTGILSDTYKRIIATSTKDKLESALLMLLSVPMDVYTLTRMFIRFEDKQRSSCNKTTIENVIIYAGSGHVLVYEEFFSWLFGNPIIKSVNHSEDDLCLSVENFDFWQ